MVNVPSLPRAFLSSTSSLWSRGSIWPYSAAASLHVLVLLVIVITARVIPVDTIDPPFPRVMEILIPIAPSEPPGPSGSHVPGKGLALAPAPQPPPEPQKPAVPPSEPRFVPDDLLAPPEPPAPITAPVTDKGITGSGAEGEDLFGEGLPGDGSGNDPRGQGGDGPGGRGPGGQGLEDDSPRTLVGPIRPPRLLTRVEPSYPHSARVARIEGTVVLQAVIGHDGSVEEIEVLRETSPLFRDAAIDAVRRWRYAPAMHNERAVRVYLTVRVQFELN